MNTLKPANFVHNRPQIGVDLDEVLADTIRNILVYYNSRFQHALKYEDFTSYNYWEIMKISRDESIQFVNEYANCPIADDLKPLPGAQTSIKSLHSFCDLHIITARAQEDAPWTNHWLQKHYGNSFRSISYTNHFSGISKNVSKRSVCDKLGIDLMIEDQVAYATDCAQNGRIALLLNKPWNSKQEIPPNVIRVQDWQEIVRFISLRCIQAKETDNAASKSA